MTVLEKQMNVTYKRVFIIGQPGAGKALLAKNVAEKLGWKFINADIELEYRVGRLLNDILGDGEINFHQTQNEILSSLLKQENIVVTTDASIVCHEQNFQLLSNELVVFLKVGLPIQLERVSKDSTPLLIATELKAFLQTLHDQRDTLYEEMARLIINSDDNDLENHVEIISKLILKNNESPDQMGLDEKDKIFFHKQSHTIVSLTDQQARCLKLLAQGQTSKEIAKNLQISFRTVEGLIAKAIEALGCSSSKELIALYHQKP